MSDEQSEFGIADGSPRTFEVVYFEVCRRRSKAIVTVGEGEDGEAAAETVMNGAEPGSLTVEVGMDPRDRIVESVKEIPGPPEAPDMERWRILSRRVVDAALDEIERMSDGDLELLRRSHVLATPSNCWYQVFGMAPAMAQMAIDTLESRRSGHSSSVPQGSPETVLPPGQAAEALDVLGERESLGDRSLPGFHARIVRSLIGSLRRHKDRIHLLSSLQRGFRDPERTVVCDVLANGELLPDPGGVRYGGVVTQVVTQDDGEDAGPNDPNDPDEAGGPRTDDPR